MASGKKIIRKTLLEVMQSEQATNDERLKAARLLTKLLGLTEGGKPRGNARKKVTAAKDRLARILSDLNLPEIEEE
jgi:hypothetical protein